MRSVTISNLRRRLKKQFDYVTPASKIVIIPGNNNTNRIMMIDE